MARKNKENEDIFGFKDIDEEILRNLDYENLKMEVDEIKEKTIHQDKILVNQNKKIKTHIDLFYETLENLAKDRAEFNKIKKQFSSTLLFFKFFSFIFFIFLISVVFYIFSS